MEFEIILKKMRKDLARRYTKGTLNLLVIHVTDLFNFCNKPVNKVTNNDLFEWISYLRKKGLRIETIKNKLYLVNIFFKYCKDEEFIDKEPSIKIKGIKGVKRKIRFLTRTELFRLMEAADKYSIMDRTILEVLFRTGLRVTELINIKLKDVNFEEEKILILYGKGNKIDFVPMSSLCKEWLKKYLAYHNGLCPYLFYNKHNKKFTRNALLKRIRKYAKIAGLNYNVGPHDLRRTCAMYLATKGASLELIMKVLRHEHRYSLKAYVDLCNEARDRFER